MDVGRPLVVAFRAKRLHRLKAWPRHFRQIPKELHGAGGIHHRRRAVDYFNANIAAPAAER